MIIDIKGDPRKGNKWNMKITDIDTTKNNAYTFIGDFLREGENELSNGDIILLVGFRGSWKNGTTFAQLNQIMNQNLVEIAEYEYREEFFSLRDKIQELLSSNSNNVTYKAPNSEIDNNVITENR